MPRNRNTGRRDQPYWVGGVHVFGYAAKHRPSRNPRAEAPSANQPPTKGCRLDLVFSALAPQWLKKYDAPAWIALDKEKMSAKINGLPTLIESGIQTKDLQAIIEFYSR